METNHRSPQKGHMKPPPPPICAIMGLSVDISSFKHT